MLFWAPSLLALLSLLGQRTGSKNGKGTHNPKSFATLRRPTHPRLTIRIRKPAYPHAAVSAALTLNMSVVDGRHIRVDRAGRPTGKAADGATRAKERRTLCRKRIAA